MLPPLSASRPATRLTFAEPAGYLDFWSLLRPRPECGPIKGGIVSANTVEITDSNFESEVLKSTVPVLIDFWAAWCGPCRALAPAVDAVAEEYKGRVKVGKLDVDANSSTSARFNIRGIPTLLLFKDGQVKEQLVGLVDKSKISDAINKHLAS
jgi:thioredoxin 1